MKYCMVMLLDNGGSRVLTTYLERCKKGVGLSNRPVEGQQTADGFMPNNHKLGFPAAGLHQQLFNNPSKFDWKAIKQAWHTAWNWENDDRVYIQKTPESIMYADMLKKNFENTVFIIAPRHPLAHLEGKTRAGASATDAARHWVVMVKEQARLIDTLPEEQLIHFTYEELTDNPDIVKGKILDKLPELEDLDFSTSTDIASGIRGRKPRLLTNMNEEKIAKLTKEQINEANKIYTSHRHLLDRFGYSIISE